MGYYTFLDLQDRISDEINDGSNVSVTLAMVKKAIVSAIEHYERERMWFCEKAKLDITTQSGLFAYVLPNDFLTIDSLLFEQSTGYRVPLEQMSYDDYAVKHYAPANTGQPSQFAIYNDQILLDPTPNGAYSLVLNYVRKLPKLVDNTDHNGWTDQCEALIRNRAKWDIFDNLLFFPDLATKAKQHELDALTMIEAERSQRGAMGRTKAYYL